MAIQGLRRLPRVLRFITSGRCVALLAAILFSGTALAAPDLTIEFSSPPAQYVPGGTAEVTLLFRNTSSTDSATGAAAGLGLPNDGEVSLVNRSCSATIGSSCGSQQGASAATIAAGGSLTITATLQFDADATGNKQITATGSATGVDNVTDTHTFVRTPITDLVATVTAESVSPTGGNCPVGADSYTPGCAARYTVEFLNVGPDAADGAQISLARIVEPGAEQGALTWTCSYYSGASCPDDSGELTDAEVDNFPAGSRLSFDVTVHHASTDTGNAGVEAEIKLPAPAGGLVEPVTSNNSASATRTRNDAADLSVSVTAVALDTTGTHCPEELDVYTPGCATAYSVVVSNAGPDPVTGATLSMLRHEDNTALFGWGCSASGSGSCPEANGEGPAPVILGTLGKGQTFTFQVFVPHMSSELYPQASLTVEVELPDGLGAPVDIDLGNNEVESGKRDIDRRAELVVEKRALGNDGVVEEVFSHASFEYEITVFNQGPSDIGNDGALDAAGSNPALVLDDEFSALLEGVAVSGRCTPTGGEPCWTVCPSTLGWVPSGEGQTVVDASTCPAGVELVHGSGSISSQRFALSAGTGSRLLTRVWVPGVQVVTDVSNTANVSISACDSGTDCQTITAYGDPGLRSDTVLVKVRPAIAAGLEVASIDAPGADEPGSAVPGTLHRYTIRVENGGQVNLTDAQLQGTFPLAGSGNFSGFVPGTVSYQCTATGNACCSVGGSCGLTEPTQPVAADSLSAVINIPSNPVSSVTYTVTGMLDPRSSGEIALAASINPGGGGTALSDSAQTNMTPRHTLSLGKRVIRLEEEGAEPVLHYQITASNAGPSFASGAQLRDGDGTTGAVGDLDFDQAQWTCEIRLPSPPGLAPDASSCDRSSGSGGIGDDGNALLLDLMPGTGAEISMQVPVANLGADQVTNQATLWHPLSGELTASVQTSLKSNYELVVMKDDGVDVAHPGSAHTYAITVLNQGQDDAYGVLVSDRMPDALQNVRWTCSAISPVPGDLELLQGVVDPAPRPGHALAMSPDGRHAYVLGRNNENLPTLYAYQRTATPGLGYGRVGIDPIDFETLGKNDPSDTGGIVAGMEDPVDLALSADGSVVYVLSRQSHSIAVFHRVTAIQDQHFGKLSFAGKVATSMTQPRRIVLTGSHIYVAGSSDGPDSGMVEVFRPDPNNQLPMVVAGAAIAAPAAAGPMVVDAQGGRLWVASTSGSKIQRYLVTASGPEAGKLMSEGLVFDAAGGLGIGDMVLAPNGRDLYVHVDQAGDSQIGHFNGLAPAATAGAWTGNGTGNLLRGAVRLAISPDGEHLLGVSPDESAVFSVQRNTVTGGLGGSAGEPALKQVLELGADTGVNAKPMALVVSPDNRHVLLASGSTVGESGPLMVLSRSAPPAQLGFIERDRDGDVTDAQPGLIDSLVAPADVVTRGRHVYVLSKVDAAITLFERRLGNIGPEDEDGSHLVFVGRWRNGVQGITGMSNPDRMLLSPDGSSLFVSSVHGNSLAVFSRNDGSGGLTFAQSFQAAANPGLQGAFGMAMDPLSRHLYVAGSFSSSIAIFSHHPEGGAARLQYVGAVSGGQQGVTGLNGIRDLVVASGGASGSQVLGVSDAADTVVVFDRAANGSLQFVQSLALGGGQRPMALALAPGISGAGDAHVYVVTHNSHSLHVLERVLDSGAPQFGRLRMSSTLSAGTGAPAIMTGLHDVVVSPNGKRVYVAAQWGHSLVAFDRYDNPGSALYGQLAFAEVRTQDVDAVDGIRSPYAVAVSNDSRNVYVAGFDSDAVASFSVGTGSMCSASGAGDINDNVTIRAGGAVIYTVEAMIRPDAAGTLINTARAWGEHETEDDAVSAVDETELVTAAQLELSKTNNQVAVVPGTEVTYDITVRNTGPGNVTGLDSPGTASVTDLFECVPGEPGDEDAHDCSVPPFDLDSISWTCSASGSGALDFLAAYQDRQEFDQNGNPVGISHLGGVGSLALIPAGDESADPDAVRENFLVAASVEDSALVFFKRDRSTGELVYYPDARVEHGGGVQIEGARSVSVSQDGRLLFVASRRSDSLTVFGLSGSGSAELEVELLATAKTPTIKGLDQALHAIVLSGGDGIDHVYVAGANDHALAAFAFNRSTASLQHLGSHVNNQGGVLGLADVEHLVASPDGAQVYALSGSSSSVVQFNRDAGTGALEFVARFGSGSLGGVALNGVSSGVFDASGKFLYLTASAANRLVVLSRATGSGGSFGNLALLTSVGQGEQGAQGLLNPRRAAISADGQHLYVTSQAGSSLAWFSLHPESGVPTYQGIRSNHSSGVEGLAGATGLVLDPQLDQIYVAGTLDRAIAHFQRQSDSWCPPSGTGPLDAVAVNIAAGGQVAFRVTARVSSQLNGKLINVANVDWDTAVCADPENNPPGRCSSSDIDMDQPSNRADLSITKDDGLAEFDGLAGAAAIAADPRNVYVAAATDNAIGMFERKPSAATGIGLQYLGVLRSGNAGVSGLTGVADIVASGDGRHVYAVSPMDNAVTAFERDAANGRLSQIDQDQDGILGVAGMAGARALALSPDGEHVYVAGGFSNAVVIFRRQTQPSSPDFGKLGYLGLVQAGVSGVSGIESPRALSVSPDGKHLYVLGAAGDTLVAFARQTNSGSGNFGLLTQTGRYQNASDGVLGLDGVRSLAISADGGHLYVLGNESGSLVHFTRSDDADGTLEFVPHSDDTAVLLVPELAGAARLRLAGDGRMHVAAAASDAILVFDIDAQGKPVLAHAVHNGDEPLDPGMGLVDGLGGVTDIAVVNDAGVSMLYAGAATDAALVAFELEAGEPEYLGAIFDGMGGIAPGDAVTYTIVVRNHGPSDVAKAHVVDHFPPEFVHVSWRCMSLAGSSHCPGGVDEPVEGNIDVEFALASGEQVEFLATGIVGAQASGRLINTATVEAIGVLDPDMSNNSATDDDTVLSPAMDLSISVSSDGCSLGEPGCVEEGQLTPGGDVAYRVIAANAGPTYAASTLVGDVLPAALYDTGWTCTPAPYAGLLEEVSLADFTADIGYRAVVADTLGRNVYAVGKRSDGGVERDTVVAFQRDPLTGVLTRQRSWSDGEVVPRPGGGGNAPPVRGISGASDIAITADGRFVYVAGRDSDSIAVFARDPASGLLEWTSQVVDNEMNVQGIGGVSALAISPDGSQLYAGGAASQAVAGFAINAVSGALSQVSVIHQGSGVNGLNGVSDLAFDETGTLLFVTADANRSLAVFRRAPATGVLTHVLDIEDGPGNPGASLQSPAAVLVYQDRVFVADAGGDAVSLLRFVDGDEPAFEVDEVIDLAATGNSGQAPTDLAFVPDQMRLYVAAGGTAQLHLYSLLDDAEAQHLASYDGADSAALDQVSALTLSPDGRQLYAVSRGDGLAATLAREPGSRCPLAGSGGLGTQRVDIAPGGHVQFDVAGRIFANATGMLIYSVSVDPRVLAHETDPSDNRATDVSPLVPAPDLATFKDRLTANDDVIAGLPVDYRIRVENHGVSDALGAWIHDELPIFPATNAGLVDDGQWSCSANLPLALRNWTPATFESRIADLSALAHTPDGRRWFGVSRAESALVELRLDAAGEIESIVRLVDGDQAGAETVSGLAGASHLAVSPDGAHLYVTAAQSNSVLAFAIAADGLHFRQQIVSGSQTPGLTGAAFVLVSADGRFVYTAAVPNNVNNSTIALFRRDADSGELAWVERIQDGLGTFLPESNVIRGVKRLHLTGDGRHLYAVSGVSESLARFEVDTNSGSLSYAGMLHGRSVGATHAGLAGTRDMVVTPGDTQIHVLGADGITLFERALNGTLAGVDFTPLPGGSAAPRALAMDTWGSRLYLADAQGAVHLYARSWSDGALEHRFTLAAEVAAEPQALLHLPPLGELALSQAGEAGGLARLTEQPISRCLAGEGGNAGFPVPVDLGVGGLSWLDYGATVHPSARGMLRNVAKAVPGVGMDPNPDNDEGIDEVQILVQSDLAISKTGPAVVIAGEHAEYVITVTNAGPSDALGIHVIDELLPSGFGDASWTCETSGEGASACLSPDGNGSSLDAVADLHVGDTLTITLSVLINPAYVGPLQNAAYLIPEPDATDPTMDDHVAPPVETEVLRRANLAVTKTRSAGEVVAGLPVRYTVAVHNIGPSDAPETRVQDFLSPLLRAASWVCDSSVGNSHCGTDGATGQGSINRVVSVPAGATLYYTIDATLRSSALGTLENTASAELLETGVPGQAEDPDLSNNSATVSNPIITRADLAVTVQAPAAYDPDSSQPMPYQVTVANLGPSDAALTTVTLNFSHDIRHNGGDACTPTIGQVFTCEVEAIMAGASHQIALGLTDLPSPGSTLDSTAQATSLTDDPVADNNSADSSTLMRNGVDLAVSIDDGRIGFAPGDATVYTIRVRNIGSVDAMGAQVLAPLATGLLDASWTCSASAGASCGAGSGGIDDLVDLPAGGTLTYSLAATLDPDIDIFIHEEVVQQAEAEVDSGQTEVNPADNAASDTNLIFKVIFRDGFEEPKQPAANNPQAVIRLMLPASGFPASRAPPPSLPAGAAGCRAMASVEGWA